MTRGTLRIALFTDRTGILAPIIPALTAAGAEIVAHVASPRAWRRWHRGDWRYRPVLTRHAPGCERVAFSGKDDWPSVIAALDRLAPDLIVSAFFPARIPQGALTRARMGGVNLHPARLPWYGGAAPLHVMLLNGAERRFGAMTLHVVTERFDAGPIIGAATLGAEAWATPARLNAALAGAAVSLCTGPLQGWIEGRITPRDQLQGTFARARLRDLRPIHAGDITVARLAYLLRFFRKGMEIASPEGTRTCAGLVRRLGPPTGEGLRALWPGRLQFDCADARVEIRRPFRLERGFHRLAGWSATSRPNGMPLPPVEVLSADQNADVIAEMAAASPSVPGATVSV